MTELGDHVALELQSLFQDGRVAGDLGLVRIDFQEQAAKAPYFFEMGAGKLHRRGCQAIPRGARGSLYAVWQPGPELRSLACARCRPPAERVTDVKEDTGSDLIYGVLSLVDQFGSVLKERGKEYRGSPRGRQVSKDMGRLISALSEAERESVGLAVTSIENLLKTIAQVNRSLEQQARGVNGNGAGKRPRRPSSNGKHHKEV